MDDLIRRSAVIDVLKETGIIQDNDLGHLVVDEINRIPTAYNVDKVVEQLQEMYEYCGTSNCADCKYDGKCEPELVFDIVKAGGVNG